MSAPSTSPSGRRALDVARASYRDISLYAPDRSPCNIDLSDNTNLFGVPPAALASVVASSASVISRYPSLYAGGLKSALAAYCNVESSGIVTGCGSDDVLDSAIRALSEPEDVIAFPEPSFAMVPIFARMNALRPIGVPLLPSYDIDVDALLATDARITYVCSPNNPTGTPASSRALERLLNETSGIVILDEAYAEFGNASHVAKAQGHGRLLVVRTLSKAFGLAGLRIGYAVGAATLITEVEKSRGPYKVSAVAERAAIAALTADGEWVRSQVRAAVDNRERFIGELRRMALEPLPSAANFVLIPVRGAEMIAAAMRRSGVAVRPMPGLPVVGDALRISIGPWPMMEAALEALRGGLQCA